MTPSRTISIFAAFLLFLCFQMNRAYSQDDEVLIIIPGHACAEVTRIAPTPVRFYQRLGDFYLAGSSRISFTHLKRHGFDLVIIDDEPWSDAYGVVAQPHPGKSNANLEAIPARALFRGEDYRIIKGAPQFFELLRAQGFVCVEIERREIPVDEMTTHLPDWIAHRDFGIVDSLIAMVSDTSIRNYIQGLQNFGTRYWNNVNRDSVSKWVRAKYIESGVSDARLDSFQYSSTWQTNVVATIPGTVDPSKELIVGGHLDATSSNLNQAPGADDNASGTSAALEMARVLKLANYQPVNTLRFMGFAAEEVGLKGSASYAQRARAANRDIRAMLNYDMIANRNQLLPDQDTYFVWYTGSEALSNLHAAVARAYTPITPVLTTSYRSQSDSYPFWQQNYKAIFLIERDFSPYYHSPNDLLQYLDMQYCGNIVRAGLATLLTLDQLPPSVQRLQLMDKGNGTSLFACWDSVSAPSFSSYKVYIGRSSGVYDSTYTCLSKQQTVTGLAPGQRYFIGVSVIDIMAREGMINELSAVPRIIPMPPIGVTAQNLSQCVQLTWRRNAELDLLGYHVYRTITSAPGSRFVRRTSNPTQDTLWTDTLQHGGVYRYYTSSIDSLSNESAPSDTVEGSQITGIGSISDQSPFGFRLYQNYPNPFNPSTQIKYEIGNRSDVTLRVFDVLGKEVATLVNEAKVPGTYVAIWNALNASSGVYMIRLNAEGKTVTSRMLLMK